MGLFLRSASGRKSVNLSDKFDTGAPVDYFTEKEAKEAIGYADKIIGFCKDNIA